jgi:BRCT domain type II-containing protein
VCTVLLQEDEEPAPPKKKAKASSSSSATAKSKSSKTANSSSISSSSSAAQPTTAELRAKVADIMQEIDKDSVTFKQFKAKLEAALGCSLAERKAELKELLHAAMEDQ